MYKVRRLFIFMTVLLFAAIVPIEASAAAYELAPTLKTAFDKMASDNSQLTAKLTGQYNDIKALQKKESDTDAAIKALHYKNEETETVIRKQIKLIDADKIDRLQKESEQTKARYKPLLDSYTALNKQVAAARSLKNKDLNAVLRLQADSMKAVVQLAKLDIKAKDAALKKAKDTATASRKKITGLLEDIRPYEVKIKAERSAAGTIKKNADTAWKAFTPLVKAGAAKPAADSLAGLASQLRQIAGHKQNILSFETKIEAILAKAKTQLPSS